MAATSINSVKTEGFDEARKKMKNLPLKVQKNILRSAIRAGAQHLTKRIRAAVPKQSGDLRKSIKKKDRKPRGYEIQADVVSSLFYSRFVEYGTAKMSAGKHWRTTFSAEKTGIIRAIRDQLTKRVAKEYQSKGT